MPPKKTIDLSKAPANLRAKLAESAGSSGSPGLGSGGAKKGASELDQLMSMSSAEIFPYACFLTMVILGILYNIIPAAFSPLVEFQYPVDDDFEEKSSIPRFGAISGAKMKFFSFGPLDLVQLIFVYLGVVSFNIFIIEFAQLIAKYVLKAPKKVQEAATLKGTSLVFHLLLLSSGLGLIPDDAWTNLSAFWMGNGLPISRSLKFYLLVQIAYQLNTLINYFLYVPAKSMKVASIVGNIFSLVLAFFGYFSGFFVGTLVIFLVFDFTSALYEILVLVKCLYFQKPHQSPSRKFLGPVLSTWLFLRLTVPFALLAHYCWYVINKSAADGQVVSAAEIFTMNDYMLFGAVFSLITMQFIWFMEFRSDAKEK